MPDIDIEIIQFLTIVVVAFAGSFLSFLSGFGLGTILLPVFSIFYDLPIAIALTGMVHLLNNIFKLGITWKNANYRIIAIAGVSSIIGAVIGATILQYLESIIEKSDISIFYFKSNLLKILIGSLIIFFSFLELRKEELKKVLSRNYLLLGGLISGFFGGLSGHQGALRSLFIGKSIGDKKEFIATGIMIACLVDIARLPIYYLRMNSIQLPYLYLIVAVISAIIGAYYGKNKSEEISDFGIKKYVFISLIIFGLCMILGLI